MSTTNKKVLKKGIPFIIIIYTVYISHICRLTSLIFLWIVSRAKTCFTKLMPARIEIFPIIYSGKDKWAGTKEKVDVVDEPRTTEHVSNKYVGLSTVTQNNGPIHVLCFHLFYLLFFLMCYYCLFLLGMCVSSSIMLHSCNSERRILNQIATNSGEKLCIQNPF